jgi:hypothetical protein
MIYRIKSNEPTDIKLLLATIGNGSRLLLTDRYYGHLIHYIEAPLGSPEVEEKILALQKINYINQEVKLLGTVRKLP